MVNREQNFNRTKTRSNPLAVGTLLRKRRYELNWNQEKVSALSGVNRFTISDIERGKVKRPRSETVYRIGRAMGMDMDKVIRAWLRKRQIRCRGKGEV